jgi:hypothetical protein
LAVARKSLATVGVFLLRPFNRENVGETTLSTDISPPTGPNEYMLGEVGHERLSLLFAVTPKSGTLDKLTRGVSLEVSELSREQIANAPTDGTA